SDLGNGTPVRGIAEDIVAISHLNDLPCSALVTQQFASDMLKASAWRSSFCAGRHSAFLALSVKCRFYIVVIWRRDAAKALR
ncbi:hypothetical protein, partial [Mesorhizobium sp.]|uniref:hypothetical protein n=1 Tax=Mesorhizobium sp. TaxID=1871066 RepID=UPI00257F3B3F